MVKRLIITGVSGLIGQRLVKTLGNSFELFGMDLRPYDSPPPNLQFNQIDLGDSHAIRHWFREQKGRFDGLINLAAYYNFCNLPSPHDQRLLAGLPELARCFSEVAFETAPFIQASSMASLEPCEPGHPISADSPSIERWSYPNFKKCCEDILRKELGERPYVEFVLAGVYTDYCELVPLFHYLESHRKNTIHRWFYPANMNRGLTYLHIDDAVAAFLSQIERPVSRPRLLIGESAATTYAEIANAADQYFHARKIPKLIVPKWTAQFGADALGLLGGRNFYQSWMIQYADEHYEYDLSATQAALNWQPRHRLLQQLPILLEHAKHDEDVWLARNQARPWHVDDWSWLPA